MGARGVTVRMEQAIATLMVAGTVTSVVPTGSASGSQRA